jgi:hypothetical protein
LGGAFLSLVVALRSVVPNTVALVQETSIAILATAIVAMSLRSSGDAEINIATAIAIMGVSSLAVGTPVTRRPLHSPGRAAFPHPVLRLHSLSCKAESLGQHPSRQPRTNPGLLE